MVQHIGLRREDEAGRVLAEYASDGVPVEVLTLAAKSSACSRFIDPYGDAIFNQRQLPVLIDELVQMMESSTNPEFQRHLCSVVGFLERSRGEHVYVRFTGD